MSVFSLLETCKVFLEAKKLAKNMNQPSLVLGIETSCDETAAAVVRDGTDILASVVSSQTAMHAEHGGVVPEVASRAHLEHLLPVVDETLRKAEVKPQALDAIAATTGPGLVGALLVGASAGKALSLAWDMPFVAVNHLHGHIYGAFLEEADVAMPLVALLVSGGHTMLIEMHAHGDYKLLGQTRDDAAGEAFDKVARLLGLGYPGGPEIDRLAAQGNPEAVQFPRPMLNDGYDFSFSGLKTAVANHLQKHPDAPTQDIAASFQAAVVDVLVAKTIRAVEADRAEQAASDTQTASPEQAAPAAQTISAEQAAPPQAVSTQAANLASTPIASMVLAGGVAANSELRSRFAEAAERIGTPYFLPSRSMCTDNAAMIAAAGWQQLKLQSPSPLNTPVTPSWGFAPGGPS